MTKRPPVNVAASVRDRLLERSRERGEDYQFLLHRYAAERFLYRLGESSYRDDYVLKGAMLFALWGGSAYRPTRDLDLTAYASRAADAVLSDCREICMAPVADDGLVFDVATLVAEPIRHQTEFHGFRVRFRATLGKMRIGMQIDVGFSNAIEPPAQEVRYPTLLDSPPPKVRAYPQEAVVAEKLHALVVLGERTTRMKDLYDLHALATHFQFDGGTLMRAITATFERRGTGIEAAAPAGLTIRFFADEVRAGRWRGYLDRNALIGAPGDFVAVGERLQGFFDPVWTAIAAGQPFSDVWLPGGPWRPALEVHDA